MKKNLKKKKRRELESKLTWLYEILFVNTISVRSPMGKQINTCSDYEIRIYLILYFSNENSLNQHIKMKHPKPIKWIL